MSSDSVSVGKQGHSPWTARGLKYLHAEESWELPSTESDCQHNVPRSAHWALDGRQLKQRNADIGEIESMIITSARWNGYHGVGGRHEELPKAPKPREALKPGPKTVEDIEKWLKTRLEPSPPMEPVKPEVETVDKYLNSDLAASLLERDPDGLSIDIDLSDKKLSLGYDPSYDQFQELHSEKFLEVCGKDGFILPEFQLDNLDPLTLANNDMMVAGEILPSTSTQPDDFVAELKKTDELSPKNPEVGDFEMSNLQKSVKNEFLQDVDVALKEIEGDNAPTEDAKVKTKPRIIKKRRKVLKLEETGEGENLNDGIMAVVAISTDKISNMTQIVINTGKEEQIYQGKTSELMEATGYFPKLPKIDGGTAWSRNLEPREVTNVGNHEAIISGALEELGYTEEGLIAMSLTTTENGKAWICPRDDCRREFNRLYALKGHLLAHYGVRPFKCDYEGCAWAFHSEFKLKRHKETHLKRKDYVCQVPNCNRRFTTVYNLWTHEKLHTRPNRIACHVPNCSERFQTKRALEIHMKSHDQEHAPYVCPQEGCGKRYYSSNALTSHQRCHSYKEVDIKCAWVGCGKIFDKPCRLKAHVRSHTGAKPYSCTYTGCEWAFSSSSKLKRHEKKHTNERKFLCDFPGCSKAFMRSEHLKEHRLTHKEGRYFQCYMCDARFSAKSSLYVHIKKHQNREGESSRSKLNPIDSNQMADAESVQTICELSMPPEVEEQGAAEPLGQNGEDKCKFECPIDSCRKVYASKSSLKTHTTRVHSAEEIDPLCTFYENEIEEPALAEPEPQHLKVRRSHGAARTGLTCLDVWRLKKKSNTTLNSVGPSDVVLGPADLGEGLLLTEELPSMYYQDELGSECQILLLDTGGGESTINLRDLE